ncbi:MAG: hypothetical protein NE330_19235 [Lentisphaeraceae bacterium]|nr:hypothetical protein [Lentisphaeraceae bacterium]
MTLLSKYKKRILLIFITSCLLFLFFLFQGIQKRSNALEHLSKASNVNVSHLPPKWYTKLPNQLQRFLKSSFPVDIDFSFEESVDLILGDKEEKESIDAQKLILIIKDLENINKLSLNLTNNTETESLTPLDFIFKSNLSPKVLHIHGERLILNDEYRNFTDTQELNISGSDIAPSIFKSIRHMNSIKKLTLRTSTFFGPLHLNFLEGLNNLEHLSLEDVFATPEQLSFLIAMKKLEFLNLGTPTKTLLREGNAEGQMLSKYYDLSNALSLITNKKFFKAADINIKLTEENIKAILTMNNIPIAYYDLPKEISDSFIILFQQFLEKIPKENNFLRMGLIDKLNLLNNSEVTDKSLSFLKKYPPSTIDFRGTTLKNVLSLPFDKFNRIHFSKEVFNSSLISKLNNQEYEVLDFSNTDFNDSDLKLLLSQTLPRVIFLDNTNITDASLDLFMDFYEDHPKERIKVSFGDREIPEKKRLAFLKRVHQWGMLQIFSSHLDKSISFPTWAVHTSKNVVHDRTGHLQNLDEFFPQLSTLTFTGKKITTKEWNELTKIRLLYNIVLNSTQSGKALNESRLLKKIHSLEINVPPDMPIQLNPQLESCRIHLPQNKNVDEIISFKNGSCEKLIIDGHGNFDLNSLKQATGLKSLIIGPFIKLTGTFPDLESLQFLKSMGELSSDTLQSISNLTGLTKLICNCQNLNKGILSSWRSIIALNALDLSNATLNSQDLVSLENFGSLEILKLPINENINEDILPYLENVPSLYKLSVLGTRIPDQAISEKYEAPLIWDFLP